MSLINCKGESKLRWKKYCVLSVAGTDNVNDNDSDNIIFTIRDTKLYVPVVTLSVRDNNEYKAKGDNKNATNEFRYFVESNFLGVNRLFVLVYSNE